MNEKDYRDYYKAGFARLSGDIRMQFMGDDSCTKWMNLSKESATELVKFLVGYFGAELVLDSVNEYVNESFNVFNLTQDERENVINDYFACLYVE